MTFGFALLLAGFVLLDAGWKGTTPAGVLRGITEGSHGAGGVIAETGRDVMASFTGQPSSSVEAPSPSGGGALPHIGNLKGQKKALQSAHPELKPGVLAVTAIVLAAFPGLSIASTTGGTHVTDSLHYEGRAVDLVGSAQEMNKAAKWINRYLRGMLTEGIHNPGLSIKNKQQVPSSFWGSETWAGHADHIHLGV